MGVSTGAAMTTEDGVSTLLAGALAGVLRQADAGHLPPFASTLGLPAGDFAAMAARHLPGRIGQAAGAAPPELAWLADMMMRSLSPGADADDARWLAHAVATASTGNRHLWQDLGVNGRETVSALLRHYFAPLYRRNVLNLKWKRFLYQQLGAERGQPDLRASGCSHCDHFEQCFPAQ